MDNSELNPLLTLAEVATYLKITERTVLRLVHKGILPGTKVGNQWRFFRSIIDDWLLTNICKTSPLNSSNSEANKPSPLSNLIAPQYVLPALKPGNKEYILQQLINPLVEERIINVPFLTIQKLLYRESISSTGIGNGVAFPHLRNPRENPAGAPPLIAGICREGTDFNAIDQQPVQLFFLLCADSDSLHLSLMSRLGHILLEESFRNALLQATSGEKFIKILSRKELQQKE